MELIPAEEGIRQRDSRSLLFNIVMDKIIKRIYNLIGCKIGNQKLKIACCADDVVLIAQKEDDLQCLLFQLSTTLYLHRKQQTQ